MLVKDIYPGETFPGLPASSNPGWLTEWNGVLIFSARDEEHGAELWTSDGTAAGTLLLKDMNPGEASGGVGWFTPTDDFIYFTSTTDEEGSELWRTDGTEDGTVLVADVEPGPGSSSPQYLTYVEGLLFFSAHRTGNGRELWVHDHDQSTTRLVDDINPYGDGILNVGGYEMARVGQANGLFFFRGTNGEDGLELWVSNGYTVNQVVNLVASFYSSDPYDLVSKYDSVNPSETLYFTASGDYGRELYRTTGTEASTELVHNINDVGSSIPSKTTVVGDLLYFRAFQEETGDELWESDGYSTGTRMVGDLRPGPLTSSPDVLTNINGVLYFSARDGEHGIEPWSVSGPGAPAEMIVDLQEGAGGSEPRDFCEYQGSVYFQADDGEHGDELWKISGSPAEVTMIEDIAEGLFDGRPENLTVANGYLFFTADDHEVGRELWRLRLNLLAMPTDPGAEAVTATSVTWTWVDNSGNEYGFNVYRAEGTSASDTPVHTTIENIESWTDEGLSSNTQYTFQVDAYNAEGNSAKTDPFTTWTLPAVPVAPVISNISNHGFDVTIGSGDSNPPQTLYAIAVAEPGMAPGWVQENGTVGDTEIWMTAAAWGTQSVTGLPACTPFEVGAKAQGGNGSVTELGPTTPVQTGGSPLIFSDGFESGNISAWD